MYVVFDIMFGTLCSVIRMMTRYLSRFALQYFVRALLVSY